MIEKVVFLKERLEFIVDHIELFLPDYQQLAKEYEIPDQDEMNKYDFHLISSANTYVWERFCIDNNDFNIYSNENLNLAGLVKGKVYIIPPFLQKQKIYQFLDKINYYHYFLTRRKTEEDLNRIEELEQNQIMLQVDTKEAKISLEQLCRFVIEYKEYNQLYQSFLQKKFRNRNMLELAFIQEIIDQSKVLH